MCPKTWLSRTIRLPVADLPMPPLVCLDQRTSNRTHCRRAALRPVTLQTISLNSRLSCPAYDDNSRPDRIADGQVDRFYRRCLQPESDIRANPLLLPYQNTQRVQDIFGCSPFTSCVN